MKTMAKLVMLLAVLAICLPAQAEILIYAKILKSWIAEQEEGLGGYYIDQTIKGFLVLEVTYDEDGNIDIGKIFNAYQVEYFKNNDYLPPGKLYMVLEHTFSVVRLESVDEDRVEWIFVETNFDTDDGELTMVRGKAKKSMIGNADPNEVAKNLSGNCLGYWYDTGTEDLIMCEWSLRLEEKWTKYANMYGFIIDDALAYVEAWLEDKGYTLYK